jgi:hypothetical protein
VFLKVGRIGSTTDSITQRVRWTEDVDKMQALLEIIPSIDGLTLGACRLVFVFCFFFC